MGYLYDDEDNAPMVEDNFPIKVPNGCWNCRNFDWKHEACTLNWNNMDESYYNPDIDDREPTDYCDDHDPDPDVDPADWFEYGGNEP